MPAKKSSTPVVSHAKAAPQTSAKAAPAKAPPKKAPVVTTPKTPPKAAAKAPAAKTNVSKALPEELESELADTGAKKKAGRPAKAAADKPAAKRGRKPKADASKGGSDLDDADLSDIEEDLAEEVVEEVVTGDAQPTEKVKPLRIKISKT